MRIKAFSVNEINNIDINLEELQELLDEAYKEGYEDGKKNNTIITYPYYPYQYNQPYYDSYKITCTSGTGTTGGNK